MPTSIIHTAVAIFVAANLVVCIKADGNPIENSQNTEANVDPLPQEISPVIREILSPDIFMQTDPFNYLREKVINLKYTTLFNMGDLTCMEERFPTAYLPYVKLLRSLSVCLARLNSMKIFINSAKNSLKHKSRPPPPDTSTFDPELASLFSLDIFLDSNPPSVLLDKLIALPETRLSSIGKVLLHSQDPVVQYYFWYTRNLYFYLKEESNVRNLKCLRRDIADIQQLKLSTPSVGQSDQK